MRFCKDCEHYSKTWWLAEPQCSHEKSLVIVCRVEGKAKWMLCREMRWDHNPCGNDARFFQSKGKK